MQEITISFHEASWTRHLYDSLHHYRSLHFHDTFDVNWLLNFYLYNTIHLDYSFNWHFHHSLDLHYSLDQFLHEHWHFHTFLHCHLYHSLHNFHHLHRHFHFNYAFDLHLNHTLYLHRHFHSALYQHFPLHENGHFHLFRFECGISQVAHCRMHTLQHFSRRSWCIASAGICLERDCQAGDSLSK